MHSIVYLNPGTEKLDQVYGCLIKLLATAEHLFAVTTELQQLSRSSAEPCKVANQF